jgi:hypothetical protein
MEKMMHAAHHQSPRRVQPCPLPYDPAALVDEYLRVLMIPDPVAARRFVSPELKIRFTGGGK